MVHIRACAHPLTLSKLQVCLNTDAPLLPRNRSDPERRLFHSCHSDEGPDFQLSLKKNVCFWLLRMWLNSSVQFRGRDASCAMTVKQHYYNNTKSPGIFSSSHMLWKPPHMHILTRCLELPEVDVDQDKVDDSRAVLFAFFWFEHVAFLQALAVKDFGVDLGEGKLVHSSPLLCQQQLLWHTFTN